MPGPWTTTFASESLSSDLEHYIKRIKSSPFDNGPAFAPKKWTPSKSEEPELVVTMGDILHHKVGPPCELHKATFEVRGITEVPDRDFIRGVVVDWNDHTVKIRLDIDCGATQRGLYVGGYDYWFKRNNLEFYNPDPEKFI